MAVRRMFSLDVVDTDKFLEMPATSQNLYFHLGMHADDDGFVASPKRIARNIGCGADDLSILLAKNFIIAFEDGVVVITHWKQNNYIRPDRYKPTIYQEDFSCLTEKNGSYMLALNDVKTGLENVGISDDTERYTTGIPNDAKRDTQVRLDQDSIGYIYNTYSASSETRIAPAYPYQEIISYLNEKAGTNFRSASKATQKRIRARFKEGFTLEDFKTVINVKVAEWKGGELEKYLRPETLFGTKFESYLNQKRGSNRKTNSFHNFHEREYDFTALQEQLVNQDAPHPNAAAGTGEEEHYEPR